MRTLFHTIMAAHSFDIMPFLAALLYRKRSTIVIREAEVLRFEPHWQTKRYINYSIDERVRNHVGMNMD
jgi:hypothetical protein